MPSPAPAPSNQILEEVIDILEQIVDDKENPDNIQINNFSKGR